MVFEQIEKLKQDYTDKFVVVDADRPELRRFRSMTGIVRTVNMNGRALVEFDGFQNIGWFDIDPDFLSVVDKPLPKEEAPKKPAAKPAAKKAASAKPASKKPAAPPGGGMSINDILAAARGDSPAKPAEAKPVEAKAPAKKPATGEMNVADILAAARGGAAAAEPESPVEEEAPAPVESAPVESAPASSGGDLPTDVDGIIAFCRDRDG